MGWTPLTLSAAHRKRPPLFAPAAFRFCGALSGQRIRIAGGQTLRHRLKLPVSKTAIARFTDVRPYPLRLQEHPRLQTESLLSSAPFGALLAG